MSKPTPQKSAGRAASSAAPALPHVVDAQFIGALAPGGTPPPPTFAEVAFAGRSNVGKSSLINCLTERRGLVRTSSTPGCTRQVNMFEVKTRTGARAVLADLPGYGFARRSKAERRDWQVLIEEYLSTRPTLRVLVLIVDARREVEDEERQLIDFVRRGRAPSAPPVEVVLVATKSDKLPRSSKRAMLERLGKAAEARVLGFSAVTAEGREELWRVLERGAHLALPEAPRAPVPGDDDAPAPDA